MKSWLNGWKCGTRITGSVSILSHGSGTETVSCQDIAALGTTARICGCKDIAAFGTTPETGGFGVGTTPETGGFGVVVKEVEGLCWSRATRKALPKNLPSTSFSRDAREIEQ